MKLRLLLSAILLAVACSPQPGSGNGASGAEAAGPTSPPLLASLQAATRGDSVRFVLQVTNTTAAPIDLRFNSGQTFDFAVVTGGREVWRWSADMMFTQALRNVTVAAGETLTHEASWLPPSGTAGELEVVGELTSSNHPVEQRVRFRYP